MATYNIHEPFNFTCPFKGFLRLHCAGIGKAILDSSGAHESCPESRMTTGWDVNILMVLLATKYLGVIGLWCLWQILRPNVVKFGSNIICLVFFCLDGSGLNRWQIETDFFSILFLSFMLSHFIFVRNNTKIIFFCYTFLVAFCIAMQVLLPLVK